MNDRCVKCGAPAARTLRALEVRTFHARGLSGEKRVQALGEETAGCVCDACAADRLSLLTDLKRAVRPRILVFGLILLAGILLAALAALLRWSQVFLLLGLAAVACGLLGIVDALRAAREKRDSLRALPEADALDEAAWDVLVSCLPAREGDNDLTYIPVNEKTLRRKNGDLMVLYRLLPEIAVEAWKRLHEEASPAAPPQEPPSP